jgi:phage tail sheath gpL-like
MAGFPLTGVDPNSPLPGTLRELLVAQSPTGTGGSNQDVLIYGNKTSAGSETVDTIGDPIIDLADCIARFGRRSEVTWLYRKFIAIQQEASVYACAATEAGTAATRTYTFATAATGASSVVIEWGGYKTFAQIASGDTAITVAAAVVAAIAAWENGDMPFTSAVGSNPNEHVVTVTTSNTGDRTQNILARLRMTFSKTVAMTVTTGSVSGGATADDFTAAYAQAASGYYRWQINPKIDASPSTTDNGMGEGANYITTQNLPANGKAQLMFFGSVGTAGATTTQAIALNNAFCKILWAEDNPWTPGMLAAHYCAINRQAAIAHPGANLTGYQSGGNVVFQVPRPYDVGSYPTTTEQVVALNNGFSPVTFDRQGKPILVRDVTTRSLLSSGINDYRAREGHIPIVLAAYWDEVASRWATIKQPFVAANPKRGQKPLAKITYPNTVAGLLQDTMRDMAGAWIAGSPVLDPGALDAMLASVEALLIPGGISAKANPIAVVHNNKQQFLIGESSPAY